MLTIELLEEDNVREGFLEHPGYPLMRDLLPDHQRTLLVIGYHLGMRSGEIINLRWDQGHDLRRTAVRNMIRAGIPEKQAMRISGHKSDSVLKRYDITDERDIQVAGDKLELYLGELAAAGKAGIKKAQRKVGLEQ
ncbi:MAG TPA: tyrosine-type recombinase/integrase [Bryobacteraceae bacterium]|jgi:integrase|nr:tyrosine-type recombinase/integrase [Bryobacteraceae bacterium]